MDKALLELAAELDDPSADLVIAALILNVRRRGDRLGEVLTGLATTAREELEMRRKISAGRAELRRGVQIVVAVTVAFAVFLVVFSGDYIALRQPGRAGRPAVVVGIFAAAFAWMRKLSAEDPIAAFLARPGRPVWADPDEVRLVAGLTGLSTTDVAVQLTTTPAATPRPAAGEIAVIALALVGACLGAALFALIWRVASPRPSALVQLARFDAHHNSPTRRVPGRPGRGGGGWTGPGPGRPRSWPAAASRTPALRQDLALTGHTFE